MIFFQVLYFVASKEAAEQISQKLVNRLKSLGIFIRCSTVTTHFSKVDFESAQILVTTVSMWSSIAHTLGERLKVFCVLFLSVS
jgi:hypothetical protein